LPKDQQLSFFISTVYMGSYKGTPIIGLEHAAKTYYATALPHLSLQEFIGLVAMIKAPNHFNPLKNPNAHQARIDRIEHIIAGNCHPNGWFDTTYAQCGATVQQ
jgi:membrane peptidoglycan carboxypeptidase